MYTRREAYAQQGIYWAETYPYGAEPRPDDWAHHIYSHKWGGWLDSSKFPVTPDQAWEMLGEFMRAKGGRHIVSSERFADILPLPKSTDVINYIKEIAGPIRVRFFGYVRRQDNLIESHIRELIKRGIFPDGSIEEFLQNIGPREVPRGGDEAIKIPPRASHASFSFFDRGFLKAADLLGKENVIVRVYERERLVGGDSVTDFLHACNLPAIDGVDEPGVNLSLNTLTSKLLTDPTIIAKFAGRPRLAGFVRDFFSQGDFSRLNNYVLLDSDMRREIMNIFTDRNAHFAEMFLTAYDADALEFHDDESKATIPDDQLVLTYKELVKLLVAMQVPPEGKMIEPRGAPTSIRKGRVSYSIEAEDLLLANAWQKLIGKSLMKGGSYLDLGAAHPVDHSNTFYLYEHGWRGICVEANPEMCALYKQYRPLDRVFNIGIAPASGTLTYHRFDRYINNGFLADKIVGEHIGRGAKYLGSEDVECVAIADFLRNEVREPVDILSIDIETMEPRILNAWDWSVCRPKLICVEIHSRDLLAMLSADVTIILKRNGYAPISRGIMSAVFIDAKFLQ